MDVYIKGMVMPKSCEECLFNTAGVCIINRALEPDDELTHSCPLVGVPPHGRLIDADALMEHKTLFVELNQQIMSIRTWAVNVCDIVNAPTILEAEGVNE